MFVYFIAYNFQLWNGETGVGNCTMYLSFPMAPEHIKDVEQNIITNHTPGHCKNAVILNFQRY
jgi:hypothetical protein